MPVREATPTQLAEKALRRAGYSQIKVRRLYPPREPGGEAEILFTARVKAATAPLAAYTAYLRDESGAEPLISDGW